MDIDPAVLAGCRRLWQVCTSGQDEGFLPSGVTVDVVRWFGVVSRLDNVAWGPGVCPVFTAVLYRRPNIVQALLQSACS